MNERERRQRSQDLQDWVKTPSYKWFQQHIDEEVTIEQEAFLHLETENDRGRLETQLKLLILKELKEWAEEEVDHCKRLDRINA